jgi:predicted ArsR family transcriptional regulator
MEYNKLSRGESDSLISRHKQERDGRSRDRIKAVLMFDEGCGVAEISKVLLLSESGVRNHLSDYHE